MIVVAMNVQIYFSVMTRTTKQTVGAKKRQKTKCTSRAVVPADETFMSATVNKHSTLERVYSDEPDFQCSLLDNDFQC